MRCEKSKRWISDGLDGALVPVREKKLDAHLAVCPVCRSYRRGLDALQGEAKRAARLVQAAEYGQSGLDRLAEMIKATPGPVRKTPAFSPRGRWAWAGAASLLAAGGILYLTLAPSRTAPESFPASFEEGWSRIDVRLEENPDLAREFASSLQTSLREPLREARSEVLPLLDRHVLFLEDLSDEEVRLLNAELAKEIAN